MSTQKSGVSALALKRQLGLRSYETAWTMLHKLRVAMKRPGRDDDRLRGYVEVDETFVRLNTGATAGLPRTSGRGADAVLVGIAVEQQGTPLRRKRLGSEAAKRSRAARPRTTTRAKPLGRVRIRILPDAKRETLHEFIRDVAEPGSMILTDGLKEHQGIDADGDYEHRPTAISHGPGPAHMVMPGVHRVASLLKRWLLGTHQGGIQRQHLEQYLDEFTFRFNRRRAESPGLLFHRLLEHSITATPTTYKRMVETRRHLRVVRHDTPGANAGASPC